MAVSKQPNISPETSNAEGLDEEIVARGETRWKKYHPFRVVRKIFRRRIKGEGTNVSDASKKSWSTSELQSVQDERPGKRQVTSPLKIGLSVSHDSIFSPESNPAAVSSETLNVPHGSSLSMHHTSIKNMFKDELFSRIRARRDSDDDDVGLPHSPCTSPTTVDVLTQGLKEKVSKSKTTCSVGSLISMGSSENDEDSAGQSSGHSSRMSLIDRRSLDSDGDVDSSQPAPLNHNAAHHRIAVKPKRTYGLPRRRMNQIAAANVSILPSTPEVIEDNGKVFQKLESTEIVKSYSEHSTTSMVGVSLKQQTESLFSFSESSTSAKDSVGIREKIFSESSSHKKRQDFETSSRALNEEIIKKLRSENSPNEYEYKSQLVSKETDFDGNVYLENSALLSKNISMETMNNVTKSKRTEEKFSSNIIDTSNQTESVLKVSSLVKSLEKSDSFNKKSEWLQRPRKETGTSSLRNSYDQDQVSRNIDTNRDTTKHIEDFDLEKPSDTVFYKCNIDQYKKSVQSKDLENKPLNQDYGSDLKSLSSKERLDTDTEFVLKPSKRDYSISPVDTTSYLSTPVTQLISEGPDAKKSLGINQDGNIIVTSRTPPKGKQNITVTEACNFAAVDDTAEFVQRTSNEAQHSSLTWIGSVDMPSTLINFGSDVTINSATSICDERTIDDKVTISVNSKSETIRNISSADKSSSAQTSEMQKPFMMPKTISKEKQQEPIKLAQKLQSSDSASSNFKGTNAQKRVSVEIVPFNQRMKEKKYDPICSKEQPSDQNKKNVTGSIERKLSDRKVPPKTKESEKNRHSFSGTIIPEKKVEIENKQIKTEKAQYPVQIRVQKSAQKSEIKDKAPTSHIMKEPKPVSNKNSSSNAKFQVRTSKTHSLEDKTAKWEVKIQNSSSHALNSQKSFEDNCSTTIDTVAPETSDKLPAVSGICKEGDAKSTPPSKGNDVNWKNPKDVPSTTSDEPEPELLRVFARRSIKQKHCDKGKPEEISEKLNSTGSVKDLEVTKSEENKGPIIAETTVVKVVETQKHILKTDLKKKSKSFCEKEKTRAISPLREMNLIRRESLTKVSPDTSLSNETVHPRQRLASVPDIPVTLPPPDTRSSSKESTSENGTRDETVPKMNPTISSSSLSTSNAELLKENDDLLGDKDGHAPSWLQLAQQRRELREQRERLLLGGPSNSFLDGSNKPARSSKVWDMVNNFQKLQMT